MIIISYDYLLLLLHYIIYYIIYIHTLYYILHIKLYIYHHIVIHCTSKKANVFKAPCPLPTSHLVELCHWKAMAVGCLQRTVVWETSLVGKSAKSQGQVGFNI